MPQVTAAAFPITIGDATYEMSPLTDRDVDEINNWLRASIIKMARDSLVPGMTPAEREELLGVAMTKARQLSFMEGEGARIISSLDGVSRVVWQGLRRRHPELQWDEFKSRVFALKDADEDSLAADVSAMMATFQEINVGKGAQKKTQGAQAEASRRPARRSTPA